MAEALDGALPPGLDERARAVLKAACDRRLRLATAESCTGGMLAALLTDEPGLSHAFERGFVVYTDEAKAEALGVSWTILQRQGAVSEACARAMAKGALDRSRADLALAITGYAEAPPGGQGEAGLVHLACARRGGATRHRLERLGDVGRAAVRLASLRSALDLLADAAGLRDPAAA